MKTLVLPSRFDRVSAAALASEFADAFGIGPVTVDASAVERVGQCGLQLLLSARATATCRGVGFSILPSDAMRDAICLCGLEDVLLGEAAS